MPTAAGSGDDSRDVSDQGSPNSQHCSAPADDVDPLDHTGERPGEQDGGRDSPGGEGSAPNLDAADLDAPDLDALASQTLDIWQDYLSASMSDPEAQEMMRRFLAMAVETVRDGMRAGFAHDQHSGWPAAHWMNAFWPAPSQKKTSNNTPNNAEDTGRTGGTERSTPSSGRTDSGSEGTKSDAAHGLQGVQGAHALNHDLASASDERDQTHESSSGKNASSSVGTSSHGAASGDRVGADDELAARVAQLERRLRDLEVGPLTKAG
ncbi:MAG: hypothetical protein AAF220_07970 [Pseudomonadota bacterium]